MSVCCGAECFLALGCIRWIWKRCTYIGGDDSATWPPVTADEFESVPHLCRVILAVYEQDLYHPKSPPLGGYRLNPDFLVKRVTYQDTLGQAPPHLIYLDHTRREIVLAIRGLNLKKEIDYKLLLNNRLGMQMFDGVYVHHGLLKSAIWLLNQESGNLKRLWLENGSCYKMVFVGHSLGSGVAALMTVIAVNHRDMLGGIPRDMIRCFALAPARCMSLNLAVKYADVIYSVILQVIIIRINCLLLFESLEDNGLRISREKTEYLQCDFVGNEIDRSDGVEIHIGDHILHPKESFRYLGSMFHRSGRIDEDVTHRIKAGWLKWRAAT